MLRYTQVARAEGELTIDGEREPVDGWYACRDHSWGIRSTMGPYAPLGGLREGDADPRALRLWVPFECGDEVGFFHCHDAHDGSVLDCEGRLDRAGRPPLWIDAVRHALRYESGTRRLAGGELTLVDENGAGHDYRFEVACAPAHPQGFGYTRGWSDGGPAGRLPRRRRDRARPLRRLRPGGRGRRAAPAAGAPPRRDGVRLHDHRPGRRRGNGARGAHAVPRRDRRDPGGGCAGMTGFVQRHGLLQGQGLDLGPYSTRYAPRATARWCTSSPTGPPTGRDKDWIVFDSRDRLTFGGAWAAGVPRRSRLRPRPLRRARTSAC